MKGKTKANICRFFGYGSLLLCWGIYALTHKTMGVVEGLYVTLFWAIGAGAAIMFYMSQDHDKKKD